MKQKVCKVFIALISLLVLLGGCKIEQQENPSSEVVPEQTENSDIEITKEYLCSEFGIAESEFEGVDFEDFVAYYDLTYEKVHKEKFIGYLLKRYKEDYGKVKIPDYREKFANKSKEKLTEDNQEEVVIVIFVHNLGEEQYYYIFDFEIGKIMYGSGSESNVREEDIVDDADETVKKSIITLFEKYDVYSWEQKQTWNYDPDVLGTFESWRLKILFKDDTVYRLHGDGLNDETAPESLDLFLEDLKALAPDSEE